MIDRCRVCKEKVIDLVFKDRKGKSRSVCRSCFNNIVWADKEARKREDKFEDLHEDEEEW